MQIRVAVSEAARETGMRSSGGQFEVLFNGVDMARFESAEPVRDEQGRPTVLFLGRHEERKGLNVLLGRVRLAGPPSRAVDQRRRAAASEVQHRRHPESDRVHWLGTVSDDEVASRLAGADVLCAPSLRGESFGMVLLEGMAAGCAVVASDIEGYRTAAGGHAALVPPGDVGRPVPCPGGRAGRRRRGQWADRRPRRRKAGGASTHGSGRWSPWPSATSTCTSAPSPPTAAPPVTGVATADRSRRRRPGRDRAGPIAPFGFSPDEPALACVLG